MIHFLTHPATGLEGLDSWDPDVEPGRFAHGQGHNLLELHRRLLARGHATTVGPAIPADTTLVVMMPVGLRTARPLARIRSAWPLRRYRVALVRSDLPIGFVRRFRVDAELVPNRAFLDASEGDSRLFLPVLRQRGLIVRDPARGDRVSTVCVKANPENVPEQLYRPGWRRRLEEIGVSLDIDSPAITDGEDQRWHDFHDVDVAICVRRPGQETISKPATKLLNAWAAGALPIASREPAYVELATDREDVIFVDDIDDVPDALAELRSDHDLRSRLRRGVAAAAAAQPTVDQIVEMWWDLLVSLEAPPSRRRAARSVEFIVGHENPFGVVIDGFRALAARASGGRARV